MAQKHILRSNTKFQRSVGSLTFLVSNQALTKPSQSELARAISYLSQLYSRGEISENAYETLVEHTFQIFVKVKVERRLSTYLERKIIQLLDKLTSDYEIATLQRSI